MATVSRRCMIDLAGDLADKWKMFGYRNNLEREVKSIEANYSNDLVEQAYQILKAWEQFRASNATYEELGIALRQVDRTDLAEKYCNGGNENTDEDATDQGMYIRSHQWNHV